MKTRTKNTLVLIILYALMIGVVTGGALLSGKARTDHSSKLWDIEVARGFCYGFTYAKDKYDNETCGIIINEFFDPAIETLRTKQFSNSETFQGTRNMISNMRYYIAAKTNLNGM